MKAKHMRERLERWQRWYDGQSQQYKNANKRPGSVKHK